jgi:hypothetical protein
MNETTRITVKIFTENKRDFLSWTKRLGISKDKFLATQLSNELQYLRKLPVNSPKGEKLDRALLVNKNAERLNITLPKTVSQDITAVCDSIGITRDAFIDMYLEFLLKGDEKGESCTSPLEKIEMMLSNPRFEFAHEEGVNPYDDLIWTDENVEEFFTLFGKTERKALIRDFNNE